MRRQEVGCDLLGNTQIREGLLEIMLVMARTEDYIELVTDHASIVTASKKKDVTVIVAQDTDILSTHSVNISVGAGANKYEILKQFNVKYLRTLIK